MSPWLASLPNLLKSGKYLHQLTLSRRLNPGPLKSLRHPMIAIDTNVLLRYLLEPLDQRNPHWQAIAARKVIERADEVFVSDIVLAELEWVLESAFELKRVEIAKLFQVLASNIRFCCEDWAALSCALMDYRDNSNVDLSDCLIARRANSRGARTLYTFENEKRLGALPIATTLNPSS
jgi:predicted nucleic-acid-binding protein